MTSEAADNSPVQAPQETGHFKRALGLVDAVAVVVGSMIGSGIFIVSADVARDVGSPGWLLMCWLLAGVLTVLGAICYSELASMYPKAGGQYVFLREAFGPLAGFLYGWTLFAVIQSGTIAAVGVAFAKFLGVFVPWISNKNILLQVGDWKLTILQLVSVGLITFLTILNCRGIETAKTIQTTFTVTKLAAIAALIVLGLFSFDKFHGLQPNMAAFWQAQDLQGTALTGMALLTIVGMTMVGPLFSCDAWNNITFAGQEVKDAERTLPRSLIVGTVLVISIYILTNIVYLMLLPLHGTESAPDVVQRGLQFAAEDRVGTAAAEIIFGSAGSYFMAAAIMISTFGCLNGLILAGARVYYAMAQDGLFFKKAGILDAKTNVPVFGLIVQGIWSAALATSGTYGNLLDYIVFAALAFYALTVAGVMILRKKEPNLERPFKVPGYPALPILYIVAALAVMGGQFLGSPESRDFCLRGLLIILSGLPVFYFWRQKQGAQV
jgi:basic amino acid/polyamine antiporter, APA family